MVVILLDIILMYIVKTYTLYKAQKDVSTGSHERKHKLHSLEIKIVRCKLTIDSDKI